MNLADLLFRSPERRRRRLASSHPTGPLGAYLSRPLPSDKVTIQDLEILSLDLETTGLDVCKDSILSVGYTLVRGGRVVLSESGHHIVRTDAPLPRESVVIHKISDDQVREGQELVDVLGELVPKLAGRALLAHFSRIERRFLEAATQEIWGVKLPLVVIDTLEIERRKLGRVQSEVAPHYLRHFNCRDRYGLPRYRAHNALEDAIATAELFLAQMAHRGRSLDRIRLRDM